MRATVSCSSSTPDPQPLHTCRLLPQIAAGSTYAPGSAAAAGPAPLPAAGKPSPAAWRAMEPGTLSSSLLLEGETLDVKVEVVCTCFMAI